MKELNQHIEKENLWDHYDENTYCKLYLTYFLTYWMSL